MRHARRHHQRGAVARVLGQGSDPALPGWPDRVRCLRPVAVPRRCFAQPPAHQGAGGAARGHPAAPGRHRGDPPGVEAADQASVGAVVAAAGRGIVLS
ncbi:hypothetical protein G6F57_012186 [Rhizopus arrhizus]|nr:hypothetical protein G6F57_012186 [Rhizopus arrhizus]